MTKEKSEEVKIENCPLCDEKAIIVSDANVSLALALEDGDYLETYFFKNRAIVCTNCCLTLPELDPEHPGELVRCWNERVVKVERKCSDCAKDMSAAQGKK